MKHFHPALPDTPVAAQVPIELVVLFDLSSFEFSLFELIHAATSSRPIE
jgi:hypothetical protein